MTDLVARSIGAPMDRVDGRRKVTGSATYAYEHRLDDVAYVVPVQSTIAAGRVASIDAAAALALPGVRGFVIGRALLYPADGDVAAAVDAACALVHRELS